LISKQNVGVLCLSVVAHVVVLLLLNSRFSLPRVDAQKTNAVATMTATLVMFKPVPQVIEKPEASIADATEAEVPIKPAVEKERISERREVVAPAKQSPEAHVDAEQLADAKTKEQSNKVTNARSILAASKGYFQRQRNNVEVTLEAPGKQSLSSMTGTPPAHNYTYKPVSIEQKRKIKMTCDTGTKKVLVVLSGFTGGTLACQRGPDLSQFIKPKIPPSSH